VHIGLQHLGQYIPTNLPNVNSASTKATALAGSKVFAGGLTYEPLRTYFSFFFGAFFLRSAAFRLLRKLTKNSFARLACFNRFLTPTPIEAIPRTTPPGLPWARENGMTAESPVFLLPTPVRRTVFSYYAKISGDRQATLAFPRVGFEVRALRIPPSRF
jgi:hypothetical protein